eukprot:506208-Rhodomonas_salina.1
MDLRVPTTLSRQTLTGWNWSWIGVVLEGKVVRGERPSHLRYSDRARTAFMTAWRWIAVLCGSSIPIAW